MLFGYWVISIEFQPLNRSLPPQLCHIPTWISHQIWWHNGLSKMKLFFLLLLLPLLAIAEEFDLPDDFEADPKRPDIPHSFSATRKYYKEKSDIQARYRARLAEALKHADGAEILLLSFTPVKTIPEGEDEKYFPILPYDSHAEILDRKRIHEEKVVKGRDATVKLLQEKEDLGGGAFCHFPIHGIRLYRGEDLIFQTSLCWECANYYIEYPDDFETASWVGFDGKPLKEFLMKEMPIPESEINRFESQYGRTNETKTEDGGGQPATRPESK